MPDRNQDKIHLGQDMVPAEGLLVKALHGERRGAAHALHLGEVASQLRQHLRIDGSLGEAALFESLALIVTESDRRAQRKAAFVSPLGTWLSRHGRDLELALRLVIGSLPEPRR